MTQEIAQALTKLFDKHRIVFWYDSKQELRQQFESLTLDKIEKLELTNNEFGIKYRILRAQPKQKFLLYRDGAQPDDLENWLLDTQLGHGEFRTDQVAMWLAELELGLEFSEVVQDHTAFFQSQERKSKLKHLLTSRDTAPDIRFKMLAVSAGAEPRLDTLTETLLAELARKKEEKVSLIARCHLEGFFWKQIEHQYGYNEKEPSIKDFVLTLFQSCYTMELEGSMPLTNDALVFLKRWKDSITWKESFETLSGQCAQDLSIEDDLNNREIRDIIGIDYFRLIDQKIISDLVRAVTTETVAAAEVASWVRQRKTSHWYLEFEHLYEAINAAAQFIYTLESAYLTVDSLADGIQKYGTSWFLIDRLYRKFVYHVGKSGESSLMKGLSELVENRYVNNYLLKVNDCWQAYVDAAEQWNIPGITLQKDFVQRHVQPFLNKDKKIFVIISDALRYEIGEELLGLIRSEDRYEAAIEPALSMLPSYTQLGMAALLPHATLSLADNDSAATVKVDGQSSQGLANRQKQLVRSLSKRATAIKAEELLRLNRDESRALTRDHDVVYVYYNRIDATGDKRESEARVFEAVEETLTELIQLVKKLAGANASNIFVTADHGFIYQHRAIAESDFAGVEPQGKEIFCRDRRFVLGQGLKPHASLHTFASKTLGLSGEVEVQIPKSINRLRLKGSGSRFVHGGASLQEVVIPIVKINKKRKSDTTAVEVDIVRGASSMITSGQLSVMLYQREAVTEKIQPRTLRAALYTKNNALISDSHELSFDIESDDPRNREFRVTFVLTKKADEANGQEVRLRLDEKVPGTSHYKEYKSIPYTMRRSFTSDFDF